MAASLSTHQVYKFEIIGGDYFKEYACGCGRGPAKTPRMFSFINYK